MDLAKSNQLMRSTGKNPSDLERSEESRWCYLVSWSWPSVLTSMEVGKWDLPVEKAS